MLYRPADDEGLFTCHRNDETCKTMLTGSVIQHLAFKELWPIPEPEEYSGSPKMLQHVLESCTLFNAHNFGKKHQECIQACKEKLKVKRLKARSDFFLSDFHTNYLAAQSKKSGTRETGWVRRWYNFPG